jgi:hypothetical protein
MALLRGVSHQEFLRTTSAREVQEYRALNTIDPIFMGDRIDAAAATVANVTFNMMKSSETTATSIQDWLPDYAAWLRDAEQEKEQEVMDQLDIWFNSIGV